MGGVRGDKTKLLRKKKKLYGANNKKITNFNIEHTERVARKINCARKRKFMKNK